MAYVPVHHPSPSNLNWIIVEVIGRLDHLIEAVYERFKDRYFLDESTRRNLSTLRVSNHPFLFTEVFVDIQGER